MKEVIAIANQKGGVGKSITAAALSAGLSLKGFHVLSLDLDAQKNFSYLLRVEEDGGPTILDVIMGKANLTEAVQEREMGDVVAGSPHLAAVDFLIQGTRREYRLKDALVPVLENYDFIVIDTPPALGTLTVNALTAASSVIVPALADIFSVQGVLQVGETIRGIRQKSNPQLKHRGILITRHNGRSIISRDMADTLQDAAQRDGTKVFKAVIREGVAVRESAALGQDIFIYAPRSKAASDYRTFIDELLDDIQEEA